MGAILLWLALKSEDGLVVDDYYKRGLEINRTLKRDIMAQQYSLQSNIRFNAAAETAHILLRAVPQFRYPESIQLGLYHATKSGFDQELTLERISDRGYTGYLPKLVPGRWYITLWHGQWRLTGSVVWPAESAELASSNKTEG